MFRVSTDFIIHIFIKNSFQMTLIALDKSILYLLLKVKYMIQIHVTSTVWVTSALCFLVYNLIFITEVVWFSISLTKPCQLNKIFLIIFIFLEINFKNLSSTVFIYQGWSKNIRHCQYSATRSQSWKTSFK